MIALNKIKYMVQLRYIETQTPESSRIVHYPCPCLLICKQKLFKIAKWQLKLIHYYKIHIHLV
jgi:predicted secreted protein